MNKIYASLLGLSLGFLFLGCQSEQSIETKATPNISVSRNINEIKLNHNQIKTAQIQLGQFSERSLSNLVHANGYFDIPPQNKADVSTLVAGYVKKTYLLEGSRVRKGQVLAILENPEFIQKQQTFLEIQGQLEYMKSEFERQKLLDEERITAKKTGSRQKLIIKQPWQLLMD